MVIVGEVRPAAMFEAFLRTIYGLSRDERMGPINLSMAMQLGGNLPGGLPRWLAAIVVSILARIGRPAGMGDRVAVL